MPGAAGDTRVRWGWRGHHLPGEGTGVAVRAVILSGHFGSPQNTPNITDRAESCGVAVEGLEVKSNPNCAQFPRAEAALTAL